MMNPMTATTEVGTRELPDLIKQVQRKMRCCSRKATSQWQNLCPPLKKQPGLDLPAVRLWGSLRNLAMPRQIHDWLRRPTSPGRNQFLTHLPATLS
jgi:hypothetical protein